MNIPLLIFMLVLAFGAGYAFGLDHEECPNQILGYSCKGDTCNHSRAEVEKAKKTMRQDPPTFNFRP